MTLGPVRVIRAGMVVRICAEGISKLTHIYVATYHTNCLIYVATVYVYVTNKIIFLFSSIFITT